MSELKEHIFENLDIENGDKVYCFKIREDENGNIVQRLNHGFNAIELLGYLEQIKMDILQQMAGEIRPQKIERIVSEDKEVE